MEPIGGYFELELRKGEHYHKDAIRLNTARNCFEYVLRTRNYKKVYVPYFTCEVMLEPIKKLGIGCDFYPINASLEPVELSVLKEEEAFVYTNYFGLKQDCVIRLAKVYGAQLIVDNAQAFYAKPIQGIDTFYSARKFFGVSDGAYLYTETRLEQDLEQDISYNRMLHLLKRIDLGAEVGYKDFRFNDDSLCEQSIKTMSRMTEAVMCGIDYETVKRKRRENYAFFDKALGNSNGIHLELEDESVPMVYPYLTEDRLLKQRLIENRVFVATYWPNVLKWCDINEMENYLVQHLTFLPIDQRYSCEDMKTILDIISNDK